MHLLNYFVVIIQATQKPRNGGGEVNLGKWGSWTGPEDNKYTEMFYDRGQNCWNGPNRSARVEILLTHSSLAHNSYKILIISFLIHSLG